METIKSICTLTLSVLALNVFAQTYTYDFSSGYDGWIGDFADYPVKDSMFYELTFLRTYLPKPLDTTKYALKISGNNHSDDLFMFIKRKITGLIPRTNYSLLINVNFASRAPTNAIGVGGPPGEGVTMKAGATLIEPVKVNSNGFYSINIDKSNQKQPGLDMDTIGHIGVSDNTKQFTLINRTNRKHLFKITTNANGDVWICIGTDSGFEATTTLYYNMITLTFTPIPTSIINNSYLTNKKRFQLQKKSHFLNEYESSSLGKQSAMIDLSGRSVSSDHIDLNKTPFKVLSSGLYYFINEN